MPSIHSTISSSPSSKSSMMGSSFIAAYHGGLDLQLSGYLGGFLHRVHNVHGHVQQGLLGEPGGFFMTVIDTY